MDVDKALDAHYLIWKKYCREEIPSKYRYFAADIIAENYTGDQLLNFACACQCFLFSRLAHFGCGTDFASKTLIGDYFASLVPQFEIKKNAAALTELFSNFAIGEISQMLKDEPEDDENFSARYEELFAKAAGVMNE